jgi:hypothetical protein
MRAHRVLAVTAAAACAAAIAAATPAAAATYELSGTQVGVTPDWALNYGGLLGAWHIDTYNPDPFTPPIFHATGTETFYGCLNLDRDGSCYKEPTGSMSFNYEFFIKLAPPYDENSEIWGSCYHPITGGTGAFQGADGVLMMVDTVTTRGVHTRWQAVLILPDTARATAHEARAGRTRARQILRRLMRTHRVRTTVAPRAACGAGA